MNCTQDCNQGRECACWKPRKGEYMTIATADGKTFTVIAAISKHTDRQILWDWAVACFAIIGLASSLRFAIWLWQNAGS
jgi:hypothetical protein